MSKHSNQSEVNLARKLENQQPNRSTRNSAWAENPKQNRTKLFRTEMSVFSDFGLCSGVVEVRSSVSSSVSALDKTEKPNSRSQTGAESAGTGDSPTRPNNTHTQASLPSRSLHKLDPYDSPVASAAPHVRTAIPQARGGGRRGERRGCAWGRGGQRLRPCLVTQIRS